MGKSEWTVGILKVFNSKRRSYLIKKDLWKNVKPVIVRYARTSGNDLEMVRIVNKALWTGIQQHTV